MIKSIVTFGVTSTWEIITASLCRHRVVQDQMGRSEEDAHHGRTCNPLNPSMVRCHSTAPVSPTETPDMPNGFLRGSFTLVLFTPSGPGVNERVGCDLVV